VRKDLIGRNVPTGREWCGLITDSLLVGLHCTDHARCGVGEARSAAYSHWFVANGTE